MDERVTAEAATASPLMMFELLRLLIVRGTISKAEAMSVPVAAAENIRRASEGSARQTNGEAAARGCELVAQWVADLTGPTRDDEESW